MDASNHKKIEGLVRNSLSAPMVADHVSEKKYNVFRNASLPMPSAEPGAVTWNVSVYAYLVNGMENAHFIFVHNTFETFVNNVMLLKHQLINKNGSGGFVEQLPRSGQPSGPWIYTYEIDFTETIDLTYKDGNPESFSPKFQDSYFLDGFIQTVEFSPSSASWTIENAPDQALCDNPSANPIFQATSGLSVFQCPKKADGTYTFGLSMDAGAQAITQDIVVTLT